MWRQLICYVFYPLFAICVFISSCNKEATPGSTTTSSSGSPYTKLITANRKYHHSYEIFTHSHLTTKSLSDTALIFNYIDNGAIAINGLQLTLVTISDTTVLFFQNFDHTVYTEQSVNFNYKTNSVDFQKALVINDTTSQVEDFRSY